MEAPATFAAQMKKFFGFQPSQSISGFMAEIKELNGEDRAYFTALLNEAGYPVKETAAA